MSFYIFLLLKIHVIFVSAADVIIHINYYFQLFVVPPSKKRTIRKNGDQIFSIPHVNDAISNEKAILNKVGYKKTALMSTIVAQRHSHCPIPVG